MHGVTISELIEKMKLRNTTPEIDTDKIVLTHPDVNRPALQLTGFFNHFDRERVQIIGYVEQAYINTMDQEQKRRMYDKLTSTRFHVWCSAGTRSRMRTFWNSVITMAFPALCLIRPPLP